MSIELKEGITTGKILKIVRIANDLSATEAAKKLGFSTTYISTIENDKKGFSLKFIGELASFYNLSTSNIFAFEEMALENNYDYKRILKMVLEHYVNEEQKESSEGITTGKILRIVRIANNLNVKEAAQKLGFSTTYISEIENDKKKPTLKNFNIFANIYNLKPSTIFLFEEMALENNYDYKRILKMILDHYVYEEEKELKEASYYVKKI